MTQKVLTPLDLSNNKITGLADGTAATDAATKGQLDAAVQGFAWKSAVRAASTANLTLSGTQTVDGVSLIAGDRVLVKDQSTGSANGVYVVAAGAWSRATDADTAAEVYSMAMFVQEGTTNGNKQFVCTTDNPITLGTTSLVFAQVGSGTTYTGGTGISVAGSVISIDTAVTARKAGATIGDGSATSFNLNHNFGTTDVVAFVREVSTGNQVFPDVQHTTSNQLTVTFATAPTAGQYRVTVVG